MRWFFCQAWIHGGRAKRARSRSIRKPAALDLEALEDRRLFAQSVYFPRQIDAIDGDTAGNLAEQQFRSVVADIEPRMGLSSALYSFTGGYTFTDEGTYTFSLHQWNPVLSFTAIGTSAFTLQELGTLTPSAIMCFPVTLTSMSQTVTMSWTLSTPSTVMSGLDTIVENDNPEPPQFSPSFWASLNWYIPLKTLDSLHHLNLFGGAYTCLTLSESGADTSFEMQYSGTDTITGTGRAPAFDNLLQTGSKTYMTTFQQSFSGAIAGQDTFTLSETASMGPSALYSFSSVSYSEAGGETVQFSTSATNTTTGTVSQSGSQTVSANNHILSDSSNSTYLFTDISQLGYGETAVESYTEAQAGTAAWPPSCCPPRSATQAPAAASLCRW